MEWSSIVALATELGAILTEKQQTIATAESCTGGGIAYGLTEIAGSSKYFTQSWVTYSNQAKVETLGIPESILNTHGAVSESTVNAMAMSALSKANADIAVATSGIAGPDGGSDNKPVGLVWFAIAIKNRDTHVFKQVFSGDRQSVRIQAIEFILKKVIAEIN